MHVRVDLRFILRALCRWVFTRLFRAIGFPQGFFVLTWVVGVEPAIHISVCLDFPGAIYKLS